MTQDEIIEIAKEAGFSFDDTGRLWLPIEAKLAKFAELIQASQAQTTSQDAERLEYILRTLNGNVTGCIVGELSDTGDLEKFRTVIDAAMKESK